MAREFSGFQYWISMPLRRFRLFNSAAKRLTEPPRTEEQEQDILMSTPE